MVRDKDGRPQEDHLAVHCFCGCSGGTLLGQLGVSRSMERDLLSLLLIYPKIFLQVFIVYHLLLGFSFALLYFTVCSCMLIVLVYFVSVCQVIG